MGKLARFSGRAPGEPLGLGLSQHPVVVLPGPYSRDIVILGVHHLGRTLIFGLGVDVGLHFEDSHDDLEVPLFSGMAALGGGIAEDFLTVVRRAFDPLLPDDAVCTEMVNQPTFCVRRLLLPVPCTIAVGAAELPDLPCGLAGDRGVEGSLHLFRLFRL